MMLQTAMRTGEVRALKWEDINQNRILVHANYTLTHGYKSTTKTNKPRWVPLNSKAQDILAQLSKESEYLFPWNRYAFQSFFYARITDLYVTGQIDEM
jgi:integrase